jgi:chemotaxis protein CheD
MMAEAAAQAARKQREPSSADADRLKDEVPRTYLHPAQLFVSADPCYVTTILGSCVAVCLWDPSRKLGGINHFLLPYRATDRSPSLRFGGVAIERLIDSLLGMGSYKKDLQAKVFGGASLAGARQPGDHSLGSQNVQLARMLLAERAIPVVAEDVGGNRGRKLIFCTTTGEAWVKTLQGGG